MGKIRLGISTCLLGKNVRYDAGHKLDECLLGMLGDLVEYVPVCPETECGLGIPREPMLLAGESGALELVTHETGVFHTDRMLAWGRVRVRELERDELCGFIFKSKSPSCGLAGVEVCNEGTITRVGVGLFASAFMEHFPLLPVEEAVRLHDFDTREKFVELVIAMKYWYDARRGGALISAE